MNQRNFKACKAEVSNRGNPPDTFLNELIDFLRTAPDEISLPNATPVDIFTVIKPQLATLVSRDSATGNVYKWDRLIHRKAGLAEAMRVHAGLESSWKWGEGVDRTNKRSMANKKSAETGIFQVSFDSLNNGQGVLKPFAKERGIDTVDAFISKMKSDHKLALEYYARLVRVSIRWAGPLLRQSGPDSVYPYLSRAAVEEFQSFLT